MKISDKIIEEIQQRSDIVDLIASYLPLKKAGRNYKALCPFHHEKSPSFMVSADKQIFHCFGCGAGGDVFAFIMKHERVEFPEAVRILADKLGLKIEEDRGPGRAEAQSDVSALYKINELAAFYFKYNLRKNPAADFARKYLEKRQISEESIEKFSLGYSPRQWDGLLDYLRKKGVSDALLLKSGLVIKNDSGKMYDRFRDRVMFPIFNAQGKIIGFGGRMLEDKAQANEAEKQPKYINSPETVIYSKSKNLYGLNFSKKAIADSDCGIVVEGYFDFIVPFQYGVGNLVASLGTAFTAAHIRIIKRYTSNLVILFDSDDAGQEAALRSLDLLTDEGMNVRVAKLPKGFDPDTHVRRFGREKFTELINSAKSLFDFKLEFLSHKFDASVPEQKAIIVAQMLVSIHRVKNAVIKNAHIKKLSEQLKVPEDAVREELKKVKETPVYRQAAELGKDRPVNKVSRIAESMLISLMFEDASFIPRAKELISCDELNDPLSRNIAKILFEHSGAEDLSPASVLAKIGDQQMQAEMTGFIIDGTEIGDKDKSFRDCINKIKKDNIQVKLKILQKKMDLPGLDRQNLDQLLQEHDFLKKEQWAYEKAKKEKK